MKLSMEMACGIADATSSTEVWVDVAPRHVLPESFNNERVAGVLLVSAASEADVQGFCDEAFQL